MSTIKHSTEFVVQKTWGRLNALACHYYDIAEAAYEQYLNSKNNFVPFPENGDPTEHFASEKLLLSASFQTIVFSGMACEAAIHQLAAIQLGDEYTTQYLDKLDLLSKWIIVPSLICGRKLNEHGPAINSLRTLIRCRNYLVHQKSLPASGFDEKILKKANDQLAKIVNETDTAFRTVILLSLEINEILGTPAGVLPSFESNVVTSRNYMEESSQINKVIARCREINARAGSVC